MVMWRGRSKWERRLYQHKHPEAGVVGSPDDIKDDKDCHYQKIDKKAKIIPRNPAPTRIPIPIASTNK